MLYIINIYMKHYRTPPVLYAMHISIIYEMSPKLLDVIKKTFFIERKNKIKS